MVSNRIGLQFIGPYRMVIDLRAPGGTSGFTTDQIVLFSESDTYTLDIRFEGVQVCNSLLDANR